MKKFIENIAVYIAGILDWVFDFFGETSKSSMMRLLSFVMFWIATIAMFRIIKIIELNVRIIDKSILWILVLFVVILYGLSLFPKVIQKLIERKFPANE